MRSVVWLLVLLCLAGIVASLGTGLFHLSRGGADDSRRLARALTVRIALSLCLFVLLILAWHLGYIAPHALGGTPR
jgi:Protein of unknown function (DUF2909)